jgi:phage terminase large subunit
VARQIVLPYAPRDVFKPYHNRTERWSCIVAHRRCGKTVACINDEIKLAVLLGLPYGRYAYVAPFLAQAKEVAWEYIKRYAAPIIADKNEGELWVELLNGARLKIHGADNPDRLRGPYLDGVVLDEYADMRPSVWGEVIRPMLADRKGWATFIGTPKGHNEFHEIWERAQQDQNWFALMLRASETGILPASELSDAAQDMTPEQYAQEFECSFEAAILGAYYGKELAEAERQGRIRDVPYDPAVPVHTVWDLGKGINMAIWCFQVVGKEIHVIDYHQGMHADGIPQCVRVLQDKQYRYEHDFVPHDARAVEIGTGRTRVETLGLLKRKPRLVPDHRVMDGINAARVTLPRVYFDRLRCAEGIEALRQYRADFDEKTKAFKDSPRHDWTSHAADAFRYLCMAWRELVPKVEKPVRKILPGQVYLPGPPEPRSGVKIRI